MGYAITIKNLSYTYSKSDREIFSDVSFNIKKNAFVAFIAPNGMGKTTMLKLITGQLPSSSGEIIIGNKNLFDIQKDIFINISLFTPDIKTPQFLTVSEALKFSLKCYKTYTQERYIEILNMFDLNSHKKKQIKQLSSGLERRVELAQTLSNNSNILILDEPCNALDFNSVKDTISVVKKMWELGKTIIYTTHQFHEIEEIYTHIMVIKDNGVKLLSRNEIGTSLSDYYKKTYEVI